MRRRLDYLYAQYQNHFDISVIEEGKSFIRENAAALICSRNVRPEGMEFVGQLRAFAWMMRNGFSHAFRGLGAIVPWIDGLGSFFDLVPGEL